VVEFEDFGFFAGVFLAVEPAVQTGKATLLPLAPFSLWIFISRMRTTLQAWGNSQGVRLPKALLASLSLKPGASVEIELTPKKDAIIVRPVKALSCVRGRQRIEDLVAAMPRGYKTARFDWGTSGREVW
jgi:antitoxin MazE